MALESVLEHLIAAINANTAAILQTKNLSTASIGPAQVEGKKPDAKPAATKPAATTKPPAPAAQGASAATSAVTYATLKQAFLTLVEKIGRDPALAVIAPLTGLKQFETTGKPEEMAPIQAKLIAAIPSAESLV